MSVRTNNGRIVLQDQWQQSGANLPAVQQSYSVMQPQRVTIPDRPRTWEEIYQPQPVRREPLGHFLAMGWQMYGIARKQFIERTEKGYYAYERRTTYRACALAAIYLALSGDSIEQCRLLDLDAIYFGIVRMTGRNIKRITAPAVLTNEHVNEGQLVSLDSHLMTLTDSGWPVKEIVHYCYAAEAWHWSNNG